MTAIADRIKRIFNNTKAEVIFLMNTDHQDSNFTYLTGFTSGVFEHTILIVTKTKTILPVSILEYEIAKEQRPSNMTVIKVDTRKEIMKIMKKYMKSKIVGINEAMLPYYAYASLKKNTKPKKIIGVYEAFAAARAVKDSRELSNIKIANRITKKAVEQVKRQLKEGMTEKEVAALIDYHMMKNGANGVAFPSIVAFDKNSALPHHMPDNTKLKKNAIVLMDIGARYNNYCADLSRTFMFKLDQKSEKYRKLSEMYKIVKEAQSLGFSKIKDGVSGSDAHNAAAEHIDTSANGKYKGTFIHALGHPIGIETHDAGPGLYSDSKEKLKANMVVSDEPGIYVVGFGGVRIEDDIIVTKKGAIML